MLNRDQVAALKCECDRLMDIGHVIAQKTLTPEEQDEANAAFVGTSYSLARRVLDLLKHERFY
jgi:hypothetical protein